MAFPQYTDNSEGNKIVSEQDGVVVIQINNNSLQSLYLVSDEKTQSFQDRSIIVPANSQWPANGPTMWYGDLWIYTDANVRVEFGMIKSKAISKKRSC